LPAKQNIVRLSKSQLEFLKTSQQCPEERRSFSAAEIKLFVVVEKRNSNKKFTFMIIFLSPSPRRESV
jgi:hypothetical protein